ncbi:MAG TPA: hypothetical protein VK130_05845 [Steroidobacteraceae bacterium]|nr:hypothetical protein [Steroidobacteraceae bacterium]
MNARTDTLGLGRRCACALAACLLTVVLLGSIGESPAQAARSATIELAQA